MGSPSELRAAWERQFFRAYMEEQCKELGHLETERHSLCSRPRRTANSEIKPNVLEDFLYEATWSPWQGIAIASPVGLWTLWVGQGV